MHIGEIIVSLLPIIKPFIIMALTALFGLIGQQLYHLLMGSRFKTVAATIVSAIEDTHDKLDGSGKLNLAIDGLVDKFKPFGVTLISHEDAEDYVREAYISLVKPLDGLKTPLAVSSLPSGK